MSERRKGKVAQLPQAIRAQVNTWIDDGLTYAVICQRLADAGHPGFNEQNISNWKDGGFQDWLKEQARLDDMRFKREFALQIVKENDGSRLHEANLHLAASQLYEVLSDFDPNTLKELLAERPENYAAIANALAKLSRGNIEVQKYKDACARALELLNAAKRPDSGGLTSETIERIERELKLI